MIKQQRYGFQYNITRDDWEKILLKLAECNQCALRQDDTSPKAEHLRRLHRHGLVRIIRTDVVDVTIAGMPMSIMREWHTITDTGSKRLAVLNNKRGDSQQGRGS